MTGIHANIEERRDESLRVTRCAKPFDIWALRLQESWFGKRWLDRRCPAPDAERDLQAIGATAACRTAS